MVLSVVFDVYRYRKASIDSIDKFKFVVCTQFSLLIKQNVSVPVNVSSFKSVSWINCDILVTIQNNLDVRIQVNHFTCIHI